MAANGSKGSAKGKRGSVKITRGPRKGQTVQAYIYPSGKWSEIKGGKAAGPVHSGKSGTKTLGARARARRSGRSAAGVADVRKLNQSSVKGRKTTRRLRRRGLLPGKRRQVSGRAAAVGRSAATGARKLAGRKRKR
jgi:hypothetical protein